LFYCLISTSTPVTQAPATPELAPFFPGILSHPPLFNEFVALLMIDGLKIFPLLRDARFH
jgi:hypothetical protein